VEHIIINKYELEIQSVPHTKGQIQLLIY